MNFNLKTDDSLYFSFKTRIVDFNLTLCTSEEDEAIVYQKFASLLKPDMIYDELLNLFKCLSY